MDFLREGILRWWRRKLTRILIKYMNRTYLAWRFKLEGCGKIWWDKVNRINTSEGGGRIVYPQMVDGIKEDTDVLVGIYFIHREMQCTWWVWEEVSRFFFLRWPRSFRRAIRDGQKQWQFGTWTIFLMPQREGKDSRTSGKEASNLNKAWKQCYISTGRVEF